MSLKFSPVIASRAQGSGAGFSARSVDLHELGKRASPVVVLDHFRVRGRPFPPHPHAGFSAVTYVFEDSQTGLRSRDSLGNDVVVGPGGICWTQAGSGLLHEELPAEPGRELHGLQVFVNLSARNKLVSPRVFRLAATEIPDWRNDANDRVRIVAGSFDGIASPLCPAEPFTLVDVALRQEISFTLEDAHNALVYVLEGGLVVRADGDRQKVPEEHAVALYGSGGLITFQAARPARFLILSGAEINEPVLVHGPFVMSEPSQIDDAVARYRSGGMGRLTRCQ